VQTRYFSDRNFDLLDKVAEIGQAHGKGVLQVALAWLLTNPLVTAPIIGANSVVQLEGGLDAVGFRLSDDEMKVLDELSRWRA
jgi:aryl-alcohol dehydrogenase-like predicted oxidoreductase